MCLFNNVYTRVGGGRRGGGGGREKGGEGGVEMMEKGQWKSKCVSSDKHA